MGKRRNFNWFCFKPPPTDRCNPFELSEVSFVEEETIFTVANDGTNKHLNVLEKDVSQLLSKAKGKDSAFKEWNWKSASFGELSKLNNFLSESSVTKALSAQNGADTLMSIAITLLSGVGKAHWAAAGLVAVAFVLERYESVSYNKEECLALLDEMCRLAKLIKQLKDRPGLKDNMREIMEESVQLVVKGALMCFSQMKSSAWSRFIAASVNAEQLQRLRKELEKIYRSLMFDMSIRIYDSTTSRKSETQFTREKYFPHNAVGIEKTVNKIVELLECQSEETATAVILCGFGGIGKTTLADAVYSKIDAEEFKFSKVRLFEDPQDKPNIIKLQKAILHNLSHEDAQYEEPMSYVEGQFSIMERLKEESCFIYVDNVLDAKELEKLLPVNLDKSRKLRLLLTARDENIRMGLNIENSKAIKVFRVAPLKVSEAEDLLTQELKESIIDIDVEDKKEILRICGGVPLALQLVSRYIRYENDKRKACNSIKEEHEKGNGQRFGTRSVDFFDFAFKDLEETYRDAFLDICCFFKGKRWSCMERILGQYTLQVLERRALIKRRFAEIKGLTFDYYCSALVDVHDVMFEIGRKRSQGNRITTITELKALLDTKSEETFHRIRGIGINEVDSKQREPLILPAEKLDMMSSSLRTISTSFIDTSVCKLIPKAIEIQGKVKERFKSLIYVDTAGMESPFDIRSLEGLKFLIFSPQRKEYLLEVPSTLNLLWLYMWSTEDAEKDLSFQVNGMNKDVLLNLQQLALFNCCKLRKLPAEPLSNLISIVELHLHDCCNLIELPANLHILANLRCLKLDNCKNLKGLPLKFGELKSLTTLFLYGIESMVEFPPDFHGLSSLEVLKMMDCKSLKRFPTRLEDLRSLKVLTISNNEYLEKLPESLTMLPLLEILVICDCKQLKGLPNKFGNLTSLKLLDMQGCEKLTELSDDFHDMLSLQSLSLKYCKNIKGKWMKSLEHIKTLKAAYIHGCYELIQELEGKDMEEMKINFIY